jgi:peptide/nickel transport system permease protein
MIPTLLGITLVVFTVMAASPGGISAQSLIAGQNLEPQAKQAMEAYYNRLYGLDSPAPFQYLRWLNNVSPVGFTFDQDRNITGFSFTKGSDLGRSFRYGRPVLDLIGERLPVTLLLNLVSIPIIYIIAITFGVRAATERGKTFDVGSSIAMLGLWSVPTMLTGVLLIGFFASDQYWRWFPTAGLSRIEALDMPFLPHWGSALEVLALFVCMGVGTALFAWFSHVGPKRARMVVLGVLGLVLGVAMASALPHNGNLFVHVLLAAFGTGLMVSIGSLDYSGLRTASMAVVGLLLGILAIWPFMQSSFVPGFLFDRLWHLALPIATLTYGSFAFLTKLTRTAVLENLMADYARTARAKGVPESQVLWKHVFRNSLLPLITVAASLLPGLLAGSVIVETIFSIDGMGKLAVEAVTGRDRELVLSVTLISGLLTLVGYLIADVCYAIADPRVSYE